MYDLTLQCTLQTRDDKTCVCRWCETERPIKYGFTALDLFQALPARCRRAAGAVSVHDREIEYAFGGAHIFIFVPASLQCILRKLAHSAGPRRGGCKFTQTRPPVTRPTRTLAEIRDDGMDDGDEIPAPVMVGRAWSMLTCLCSSTCLPGDVSSLKFCAFLKATCWF